MSYNLYTLMNIFTDQRLNAVCDYMLGQLTDAFPPDVTDPDNNFVLQSCILSGKAAEILRDGSGSIRNVTFECDRIEIYNWLVQNLGSKIFNCPQISFQNRILFYPQPDLFFEIWFANYNLDAYDLGGLFVQNLDDIPTQTL